MLCFIGSAVLFVGGLFALGFLLGLGRDFAELRALRRRRDEPVQ